MAYSYNSPNFFNSELDADWNNTDPAQYLWDSPQPENQPLPSAAENDAQYQFKDTGLTPSGPSRAPEPSRPSAADSKSLPHRSAAAQADFAARPSTSENSSQSSSSGSSAQRKRKASSTSSPPPPLAGNFVIDEELSSNGFKMDRMFEGSDEGLPFEDSAYPSMGQDMNNLSLNMANSSVAQTFDFDSAATSPDAMGASVFTDEPRGFVSRGFTPMGDGQAVNASPQMTIQPSKTFFLGGGSGDDSPNSNPMMNSHENSPSAMFSGNSPQASGNNGFAQTFSGNNSMNGLHPFDSTSMNFGFETKARSNEMSPAAATAATKPYAAWPCQLEVDPTPEKSRVETQIPIKLTLHNAPRGINKLHLPAHTISKPKFQSKPPFEKSDDTLELSAMLVCASAIEKPGIEERAFKRAAEDDIYLKSEENQPASSKIHSEDSDPSKPLNGGPVAICSGCIVRERKRAARKKTKKAEEEEEWAKDEAKRVIVFNCPEVRDWCVPGTKETPVQEHNGPLDSIFVHAPMRIACYCRHQSEKIGFQVIFTLRTASGAILAQAISHSIMITDDHKQPSGNQQSGATFGSSTSTAAPTYFHAGQGIGLQPGAYPQPMPFRNSFSTNDLRSLGNTYAPQRHPTNLSRDSTSYSQKPSTATSTATATPRNLSRPASPTDQTGPSTKKRRSGGSNHNKVPSGLTMTRLGDMSPGSGNGAGPTSAGFAFSPSLASGNFNQQIDSYQSPAGNNPFRSGPPTPLHGPGMPNFSSSLENDMYFYSAPTSQHGSRAPSPTSGFRGVPTSFPGNVQILEQASMALARLPPGFNLHRPPIIQRVIPNLGPQGGGDEVTILGTGFFQGLEVMFGDNFAAGTTFWGDTTLVCRSPPGKQPGMVQVIFKHQHQSSDLQQLRGILPTQPVYYEYFDDDRNQMQMLAVDISSQGSSSNDASQMSQDELSRAFLNTSGGFSNFPSGDVSGTGQQHQQRPNSAYDIARLGEFDFENLLLNWLGYLDMRDSPYQPRYNKKNRRGGTLLALAAGRGYLRFCAGLLARGADPNPRDRSGYTPLMMSSLRNQSSTLHLLLVRGADSTLRTLAGYTAADLAATPAIASLVSEMSEGSFGESAMGYKAAARRPSSTPSVDSLSGLSTSSQPSNVNTVEDSERNLKDRDANNLFHQNPWNAEKLGSLTSDGEEAQAYSIFQAFAALAVWREQMVGQLQHLQQTVWHLPPLQLPSLPPMPRMPSLPQKINRLDYQQYYEQYPMVRRISDFLSPGSTSPTSAASTLGPPAYEDIFPGSSRRGEQDKTVTRRGALQATIDAAADEKCAKLFDGTSSRPLKDEFADGGSAKAAQTKEAAVFRASGALQHPLETGSLFPWIFLIVAILLGLWNYTAPETCPRSAPLVQIKGILERPYVAGPV